MKKSNRKSKIKCVTKRMKNKKFKSRESGITLIALVITIVALLILAGVSIATLTGDSGLLTKASEAKIMTALGAVKEEIELDKTAKLMENKNVTVEQLLAEGKVARTVQAEGENYYMYYAIKPEAYEEMQGLGKGTLANLKDVFLIDDEFHVRYIDKSGKEYGDNINNKILEDETEIRFSSKAFSEYVSRISGVTETEMKFKWMKNQTSLTIDDSSVDSLEDLVFFPNLETLVLNNITLENLDGIQHCSKLGAFKTYGTIIDDYTALSNLPALYRFSVEATRCDFDNIIDSLKNVNTLKNFKIASTTIGGMERVSELTNNLTEIAIGGTGINKIEGLENKINLTSLYLSYNNIAKIEGIEACTKLKEINLNNNKISKIEGLESLTNLTKLNLNNNQITDITPLSINTSLTSLELRGNTGIDGNRSNYTGEKLEAINKIGEILDRNGIITIDVDKLGLFKGYKELYLSNQNLTTLEYLEGQTELTRLDLSNNNISLSDEKSQNILKSMTKLTNLSIGNNPIETLEPINELKNLQRLELNGMPDSIDLSEIEDIISNISIFGLNQTNINSIVNCASNKITKINLDRRVL